MDVTPEIVVDDRPVNVAPEVDVLAVCTVIFAIVVVAVCAVVFVIGVVITV